MLFKHQVKYSNELLKQMEVPPARDPDPRRFAGKRREEPRIGAESRGISVESPAPAERKAAQRTDWVGKAARGRRGEERERERGGEGEERGGGVWLGGEGNRQIGRAHV